MPRNRSEKSEAKPSELRQPTMKEILEACKRADERVKKWPLWKQRIGNPNASTAPGQS